MKHLGVLERAGLVNTRKTGRIRRCVLVPARLSEAECWLAEQRTAWEHRADRRVDFVERLHGQEE